MSRASRCQGGGFIICTAWWWRDAGQCCEKEFEAGKATVAVSLKLQHPLILMDGTLPLLDGFAATRRIRELASGCDVPIVLLSGHAQPASEAQAFAAGCTDYLVKPFALGELERMLERHLTLRTSG